MMTQATHARLTTLRPMLSVVDLPRTMRFYVDGLGFRVTTTFGNPPVWCEVARDDIAIMFNAPPRADVERDVPVKSKDYQVYYIHPDDVVALHQEFGGRGVAVGDLRVTVYGMKEFEVRDPDGYWLWFGQETDDRPTVTE